MHVRELNLDRYDNRKLRSILYGLIAAIVFTATLDRASAEAPEIDKVKFSSEERELLKSLDQIQSGAGISRSMLKATPFVQIFTSTSPDEIAVTVTSNEWDLIYGALKGLGKLEACKTSELIFSWREVDGNSYSSTGSESFFEEIKNRADTRCK